jgi:hypothetical protein
MKKYALLTSALIAVTATIGVAGVHIVGGPYTTGNTLPFWAQYSYCPQVRWQCLWRQNEITEAGPVTKIEWLTYPQTTQGGTFHDCKMLLCHSNLPTLTATYASNYTGTPVTVYEGNFVHPPVPGDTWYTIVEPKTEFYYNNSANLLMEVSWTSATGGGRNYYRCMNSGGYGGRVYAYYATARSGTLNTDYTQYGRLSLNYVGVAPTSLGRVKSIFK